VFPRPEDDPTYTYRGRPQEEAADPFLPYPITIVCLPEGFLLKQFFINSTENFVRLFNIYVLKLL
jgi:hypothetical protein